MKIHHHGAKKLQVKGTKHGSKTQVKIMTNRKLIHYCFARLRTHFLSTFCLSIPDDFH